MGTFAHKQRGYDGLSGVTDQISHRGHAKGAPLFIQWQSQDNRPDI